MYMVFSGQRSTGTSMRERVSSYHAMIALKPASERYILRFADAAAGAWVFAGAAPTASRDTCWAVDATEPLPVGYAVAVQAPGMRDAHASERFLCNSRRVRRRIHVPAPCKAERDRLA